MLSDRDLGEGLSVLKLSEMTLERIEAVIEEAAIDTINNLSQEMGALLRECSILPGGGQPLVSDSRKQRDLDIQMLGSQEIRERLQLVLRLVREIT